MVNPKLLTETMIVTPNKREQEILGDQVPAGVTILAKGMVDVVKQGDERVEVPGGNPGMTKGGTGDVLSGIVVGLYAKSPAVAAAVAGSYVNKLAGDRAAHKYEIF